MDWRIVSTGATVLLAAATATAQAPPRVRWADILSQTDAFFGTAEAQRIAETVLLHQRDSGGWPKDVDMTGPPAAPRPGRPDSTIDNGATTTQIRFLARVAETSDRGLTPAALRGIDYLLDAQYPRGGWPQFYPLRNDYSRHITFNDNAMVNVLELLDEVARGRRPFGFVDARRRSRAADAIGRGVAMILEAQIRANGTLTAWCAQHDEVTLEPRGASAYEHPSVSGAETVGIIRLLMRQPRSPGIERAVDAAVGWLQRVRLADGRWARFYEIGTNRPIFSGRDGIIRYDISQIESERRDGYAWYGTWGQRLLDDEYPKWKAR
jgi:PelA/Pel-15E family pectate lyase